MMETQKNHFAFEFTMESSTETNVIVAFRCGKYSDDITIDNVSLTELDPSSIQYNQGSLLQNFELNTNYPNPFNASTTITYHLFESNHITLKIYNSMGQEVRTLVNEYQNAGEYKIPFSSNELTSGIYFYQLQSGKNSEIKKILLIK